MRSERGWKFAKNSCVWGFHFRMRYGLSLYFCPCARWPLLTTLIFPAYVISIEVYLFLIDIQLASLTLIRNSYHSWLPDKNIASPKPFFTIVWTHGVGRGERLFCLLCRRTIDRWPIKHIVDYHLIDVSVCHFIGTRAHHWTTLQLTIFYKIGLHVITDQMLTLPQRPNLIKDRRDWPGGYP